jgi:hypothetical protein
MQPRYDQAELPIQGIEPHEMETPLPPMRDYSEMPASRYTDPTARWAYPTSPVVFNPIGPWRRE